LSSTQYQPPSCFGVDTTDSCFSTSALFFTGWEKLNTIGWPTPTPVLATAAGAGMRFGLACLVGVTVVSWLCCSTGLPSEPWACATTL
jgi:hypothetical protein